MRARRRARARAGARRDRPGGGCRSGSPRATKDMTDRRRFLAVWAPRGGIRTSDSSLGSSFSSTTVAASLVSVMAWSADARRPAGAPAETRNAPADALEPLRAMEPAEGAGAPTRAAAAGVVRETRAPATGTRQKTVFAVTAAIVRSVSECGGALERCEMRARGAASPTRSVRGRDLGLRFCRRPPGTLSANQNAPFDFRVVRNCFAYDFEGHVYFHALDRRALARQMSRLGPPLPTWSPPSPPRARWRPLTRRPRVPVRTPVRSPDLTLRRLSVTPRAGDAPSPPAHVDALRREGWCVVDDFLAGGGASAGGDGGAWASALREEIKWLATTGLMRPNRTHFANPKVRRLAPPRSHQPPPPPPLVGTPTN